MFYVAIKAGLSLCDLYNIISIHRTQNQAELAEIYTAADLFVNLQGKKFLIK